MSLPEPGSLANLAKDYQARNPLPRDLETIAWAEVNKQALGIVKDAIERLISDVDKEGLFKYKTDASTPQLSHPLNRTRIAQGLIGEDDDTWKEVANLLRDTFPDVVKERLVYELDLPFQERSPLFQEVNNMIDFAAKALVFVEIATQPLEDEIAIARSFVNVAMPQVALKELVTEGTFLYQAALGYLHAVGHNHVHFDQLMHNTAQIESALNELSTLSSLLEEGNLSVEDKRNLAKLSNRISVLNELIHRTDFGTDLQILKPTMYAMATLASALTLSEGAPSFALGMQLASIGLTRENSALNLLGTGFYTLTDNLSHALIDTLFFKAEGERVPLLDPGARLFFPHAVSISMMGIAAVAVAATEYGFGPLPDSDYDDPYLSTELAMNFAFSSGLVKDTFGTIAKTSGASEDTQKLIAEILAMIALFYAILAAARGDTSAITRLTKNMSKEMEESFTKIEGFLNEGINTGALPGDLAQDLHMRLMQGQNALGNEDIPGLMNAYTGALNLIGINEAQMMQDIDAIRELSISLTNVLTTPLEDSSSGGTGIFQG